MQTLQKNKLLFLVTVLYYKLRSDSEHLHASVLLEKLADRKYGSIEDVIGALK